MRRTPMMEIWRITMKMQKLTVIEVMYKRWFTLVLRYLGFERLSISYRVIEATNKMRNGDMGVGLAQISQRILSMTTHGRWTTTTRLLMNFRSISCDSRRVWLPL